MSETKPQTRMQRIGYRTPTDATEPDQLVLVEYVSGGRIAIITLNPAACRQRHHDGTGGAAYRGPRDYCSPFLSACRHHYRIR